MILCVVFLLVTMELKNMQGYAGAFAYVILKNNVQGICVTKEFCLCVLLKKYAGRSLLARKELCPCSVRRVFARLNALVFLLCVSICVTSS